MQTFISILFSLQTIPEYVGSHWAAVYAICRRSDLTWHSQVQDTSETPACIVAATIPWVHWKSRVQSG